MSNRLQRFGQVEFGGPQGRLTVCGRPVELDRASRALLSQLLDEAGNDVSKDRLLEAGWPGKVVDENSLAKAISRLRQALGEDGRVLETVHRYGYRLAAEIEEPTPAGGRLHTLTPGVATPPCWSCSRLPQVLPSPPQFRAERRRARPRA